MPTSDTTGIELTTCIIGTPQTASAMPGSTEWIKAHLARMDDIVAPAVDEESVVKASQD
jgi:hypothetical protein